MNIPQMAAQAREHWKVTNPEIYRQMVEDKALVECSEAAAKLTLMEMKTLMLGGLDGKGSMAGESSPIHISDSGSVGESVSAGTGRERKSYTTRLVKGRRALAKTDFNTTQINQRKSSPLI